jgi:hypothetical protein
MGDDGDEDAPRIDRDGFRDSVGRREIAVQSLRCVVSNEPSVTGDPMQDLRTATAALSEATGRCVGHLTRRDDLLAEWVAAVGEHAVAVEAALLEFEGRLAGE